MDSLTILAIAIPLSAASVIITKLLRNSTDFERKRYRQMSKLDQEYIQQLEEDNQVLKDQFKSLQNSMNRRERGPKVEGEMSELNSLLPELVKEFAPNAPKWLQPLLGDTEVQKWVMEYISKNPEKLKDWIPKFIKPKGGSSGQQQTENDISV